ncbi:MAG: NirD/YgiW/YdeI family stress tolerance protein [Alphaproteobacteria bacterium]|nr:NirD/YgiW/YdeI family stress tolerance protein [Alphaproteobacteria bacterium]
MKKISMLAIACMATISGANAAMNQNGMGGFSGGEDVILTVEQVKGMNDNSKVWVEGAIIQKNGDEKYMFQDSTGTIMVEIDDDAWHGLVIGPTDTVRIFGEVDHGLFNTEIDIDYIEKLN